MCQSQNGITFWLLMRRKHETEPRKEGAGLVFAATLQWDLWDTSSFTLFALVHSFAVPQVPLFLGVIYVALKESLLSQNADLNKGKADHRELILFVGLLWGFFFSPLFRLVHWGPAGTTWEAPLCWRHSLPVWQLSCSNWQQLQCKSQAYCLKMTGIG